MQTNSDTSTAPGEGVPVKPTNGPNIKWLTVPLAPEEIEFKIQSVSAKGTDKAKTLVVPYLNNRAVMERFDKAFGISGWQSHFEQIEGGFICRITAEIDGKFVTKSDGANRTDIEPVKGGISDAMKRCAVQFGLGRSLYNYPKIYLTGDHKYIPGWGTTLLDRLVIGYNTSSLDRPVYIFNEAMAQKPAKQYDPGR